MLDATEYRRWHATAVDALDNAAAQADRRSHHWACFLCEQSAQLALKALLHGVGAGGWGHDLMDLGARCARALAAPVPQPISDGLARLGRFYIASRYPDAHPSGTPAEHFTAADARQAITDARAVIGFVERRWEALTGRLDAGDDT